MKRNTPNCTIAAYSWFKMDNGQRHEVVKFFEREYGLDFAHKAKFGNQCCKPAVGAGKLLSKKKDLTKDAIDYYLNALLDHIVTIRSLVPLDLHLPTVRRSRSAGAPKFGVYAVNPSNGQSFAEVIFDTREAAEKDKGMFGKFVYDANSNEFICGKCREKFRDYISRFYEPGIFGAIRKFDIHEGVDIYTHADAPVYAVEDGVVTAVYEFTGKNANCSWWNPTWCVKVEGKSGVVTYGELSKPTIEVGEGVLGGVTAVGHVTPVLRPEKYRPDIRNHSVAMLHLELRTETCHLDGWKLDGDRDKRLLDPTPYLKNKDLITV